MLNNENDIHTILKIFPIAILQLEIRFKSRNRKDYSMTKSRYMNSVDETQKVSSEIIWLWIAIDSETKNIHGINISKERNMFVVERVLLDVVEKYGLYPVTTNSSIWYLQACKFLELKHQDHLFVEKTLLISWSRFNSKQLDI